MNILNKTMKILKLKNEMEFSWTKISKAALLSVWDVTSYCYFEDVSCLKLYLDNSLYFSITPIKQRVW